MSNLISTFSIYCIINNVNNKVYIGQTSSRVSRRIKQHIYDAFVRKYDRPICSDMRELGLEKFSYGILDAGIQSKIIDEVEICYIKKYNCIDPNGYNINKGGGNILTYNSIPNYSINTDNHTSKQTMLFEKLHTVATK